MIENILPDIYRIQIPLPNSPLKSLNSYLIKGKERNLLKNRLDEIISIIKEEKTANAYKIASKISWDISLKSWDSFSFKMKWFATSE